MTFEWDERKNRLNFRKHGIWFEEAQTVWADKNSVEFFDPDHSITEDRYLRIGHSRKARLILIIFCEYFKGSIVKDYFSAQSHDQGGEKSMKKEYDLKMLKKRPGKVRESADAVKTPISLRLDGAVLADLRTEAERLGVPYQTLIGSILHRYAHGDLIDVKAVNLGQLLKNAS